MAENQAITVVFGNDPTDGGDIKWNAPEKKTEARPMKASEDFQTAMGSGFAFQLGKTAFHAYTSRIGSYTGDYLTQNVINNLNTGLEMVGAIGLSLSTMNFLPIVMEGVGVGLRVSDYLSATSKGNLTADLLSSLTGTSASNRSRGTGGKI